MPANVTCSVPEWRRPTDQGPNSNSRPRRGSTREGNRGNRGGRGKARGANGGGPPRKDSTPGLQDAPAPPPKVVVNPPTTTNTPAEPSPPPKPDSRPQPTKKNSVTVSEDPASVPSQTSARAPNRRRRSQQGRRPSVSPNNESKLLRVQASSRKASTEPPSPNPAKDFPSPNLATATSTTPAAELKSDLDALVERVRAVAMDRPHTPGSHIDWADDDDSLPDLNEWGYSGDVAAPAQPEEPQTSIPPIFEDAPLETVILEVKVEGEGESSRDETKPQGGQPGPVSDATPPTHKAQKTRPKRGGRLRGDTRTHKIPQALNLTDSVSQDSTLSPIQPTSSTAIAHTNKPQGAKRQNPNQGQNPRNNQGRTNSRDNVNGSGRQRGRNGVTVASPMRNSFPAKTEPKADPAPAVQSQVPTQGPDVAQGVTNPSAQPDPKPAETAQRGAVSDKDRKEDKPNKTSRKTDGIDPSPSPAARNDTPPGPEPTQDNVKSNSPRNQRKRNSHNPSHSRSHTYGGRTQSDSQQPDSVPTPSIPQKFPDSSPTPPTSGNFRPSNSHQSPGLGPTPKGAGFEKHSRNHSSPPGVGDATRQPHSTRPVISGKGLSLVAKALGNTPGSPKKGPPVSPPES